MSNSSETLCNYTQDIGANISVLRKERKKKKRQEEINGIRNLLMSVVDSLTEQQTKIN